MINESIERPSAEIVQGFRNLLSHDSITCTISDCMGRFNAMTSDMRPLFEGIRLVGTAITVKTLAADLAAAFKAIDVCQPGDIVVIDSHGSINTAFWGENMTMSALNRRVIAAVIDGACRDVEEIRKIRFPVICKGIVPNVGAIAGYGDVNVSIQCAGVAVSPGDIVVVDGNGVVVVPMAEAAEILQRAHRLLQTEHLLQEKIKAGVTIGELVNIDEVFKTVFGVTPIKPYTHSIPLRTSYTPSGIAISSLCAGRPRCSLRIILAVAPAPSWHYLSGSREHSPA